MTTYSTQNPVGSAAAKDLYDNAENLDVLVNDITLTSYPDRRGVNRKTWYGIEKEFNEFLINAGFVNIGNYAANITVTGYNQTIRTSDGKFWRLNLSTPVPYVTTGAGMPESGAFIDLGDVVYLSQVGSGPSQIPKNSDLGTASKADVTTSSTDTTAGRVLKVGDFSLGGKRGVFSAGNLNSEAFNIFSAFYTTITPSAGGLSNPNGAYLTLPGNANRFAQIGTDHGQFFVRCGQNITAGATWHLVRTGGNTTVDSNGFVKQASPIINLFSDQIEPNESLEVAGAEFERVDIGHYVIRNIPKLSRDGWYIETPKDRNNNIYFTIDYDESVEGELTIRTYEPDYSTGRATNGEPMDIIEGRFVALRFEENPALYPVPEEVENEESINPDSN